MPEPKRHVLLSGVVGSTAYGLATPDSDVDRLGLFAYDTPALLGLRPPEQSIVQHEPDVTLHEVGKYVKLALGCNPTVLELMWLADYEVCSPFGAALIDMRTAFLNATGVRNAYLGYATQQFQRLKRRGDGSFSADTRKRTAKHARHLMRLCFQGFTLYSTGQLPIRLEEPDRFREFGDAVAEGDTGSAEALIATYETLFDLTQPALHASPDLEAVEGWLMQVLRYYWDQ